MKTYTQQADGNVVVDDPRTLQEARAEREEWLRKITTQTIYDAGIDELTQNNAALGIYSATRNAAIKAFVASCRAEYLRCLQLISDAQTNDAVDCVQYLPPTYQEAAIFTAEDFTARFFTAAQILALQRFEFALQQAGKPLGSNMSALKTWLEQMLLASADPTPRSDWQEPSVTYAEAAAEAVAALQS